MTIATVLSREQRGIDAPQVRVEVDIGAGLPTFNIVPCPCGYLGDANDKCHCTADQVQRYRARISGRLLDRLDLHVYVPRVQFKSLREPSGCREASAEVAARVMRTRELQTQRQGDCNAHLDNAATESYCTPNAAGLAV
jgi:magnesium chelatase family protein